MKPYYERIVAICAVVPALIGLLYWLFPDLPLSLRIIFGLPMVLAFLIVAVWPERKGKIWPHNTPSNRRRLWFQRYVLGFSAYVMLLYNVSVYSLLFPVPSYLQYRTNSPLTVELLDVGVWIGFVAMVRHYIRSLPPKD